MEKDIGKIKKNDNTDIVVRIDDFGGKAGLTIREFTTSDRYTGFTKSGTRVSAENFSEFKALIDSIKESDLKAMESSSEDKEAPKKTKKVVKESEENPEDYI
ncbi:MAG: hypothetical protein Q7S33_00985 [Nanoarchaeota archaeon]|nr:hypothetical protein [Nanoarchaeota archaeon]